MKQRSLFSKPKSDLPEKPVPRKPVTRSGGNYTDEKNPRFTQPFLEKQKLKNPDDIKVYEDIQRHRLRMLIWSKLYYGMDSPIVSDQVFDKVGRELVRLQAEYREISKIVAYAEEFKDWDATTGFHLPLEDPWVCWKAKQILEMDRRSRNGEYGNQEGSRRAGER